MSTNRLEAFTDAVISIVMTLLVLELSRPTDGSAIHLFEMRFEFMVYLLSFITLAIYWSNHHHIFQITHRISGRVLWYNITLLLFLSLIPFSTTWVDGNITDLAPEMFYGCNMLAADVIWLLMTRGLIAENGPNSSIAQALAGSHKSLLSIGAITLGLLLGIFVPVAVLISCIISLLPWIMPDRRIEGMVKQLNQAETQIESSPAIQKAERIVQVAQDIPYDEAALDPVLTQPVSEVPEAPGVSEAALDPVLMQPVPKALDISEMRDAAEAPDAALAHQEDQPPKGTARRSRAEKTHTSSPAPGRPGTSPPRASKSRTTRRKDNS
ncbi:MAG: TMEM175 family protein [Coriobacteriales bacterium]|jgi:uncharacterized membrane protein|nr:TMEM175 family protein [Coriobacteriales bacterium]